CSNWDSSWDFSSSSFRWCRLKSSRSLVVISYEFFISPEEVLCFSSLFFSGIVAILLCALNYKCLTVSSFYSYFYFLFIFLFFFLNFYEFTIFRSIHV